METRFFLFAALLLTSFAIKAQMFTAINLMTPHYYPGEIYFTDGHHEEFAEIELPQSGVYTGSEYITYSTLIIPTIEITGNNK